MTACVPQPTPYRIIALDLDGTLLNTSGEVSPADSAALHRFAASGGIVVLASGRMTITIKPAYDALGLASPIIAYNGALVRGPGLWQGELIAETPLPARYADALIDYAARERLRLNYYLCEQLYARDDPQLRRFSDLYSQRTGATYTFLPDLDRFRGRQPTKALIVTDRTLPETPDPRHRDELYAHWLQRWGSEIAITRSEPEYLEFLHRDAHKGKALAALARHYDVPQELTLAIGDSFNDLTMLDWAGCGIALANAAPEVQAAADWVSPLTHNQSAVADAIARLVITPDTA